MRKSGKERMPGWLGAVLSWLGLGLMWLAVLGAVLVVAAALAGTEAEATVEAEFDAETVELVVVEALAPLKAESVVWMAAMVRIERIGAAAPSFGRLGWIERIGAAVPSFGRLGWIETLKAGVGAVAPIGVAANAVRADAVPALVALEPAGAPLEALVAVAYGSLISVSGLVGEAPAVPSLQVAAAGVDAVLAGYGGLTGLKGFELDPLLVPHDLWRHGPLGLLATAAREAAAMGEQEQFEELSARFWEQYRIAVERRAVLGGRGP